MAMFAFLFAALVCAEPFIVFDKVIAEEDAKVNSPVHVIYRILNTGDSVATNLNIDDAGIPREQWEYPTEADHLKWSQLAPGENITHIFEAVPLIAGSLRMSASRLHYVADGQKKLAFSSQLFWFEAKSTRSIGAKSNLLAYGCIIGASVVLIFVPLLLWFIVKPATKPAQAKSATQKSKSD